jgi:hypothetical protein
VKRAPTRWEDVPLVLLAILCAASLASRILLLLGRG